VVLDNDEVGRLLAARGFPEGATGAFRERRPGLLHRSPAERERYLHYLSLVSYEFASRGDCVVLGRGGQILFAGVAGATRIRVIAPLEDRIARMRGASGGDERQARQAVLRSDDERTGFHRHLFDANWNAPELYDLVVNTHRVSLRTAATLIRDLVNAKETKGRRRDARRALERLFLKQKAIVTVLYERKLPIRDLELELGDGTVTLRGTARDHPSIERCGETVAGVLAAETIRNEISFDPRYVELLGGIHQGMTG